MNAIAIRELPAKTGAWLRKAARYGEIRATDRGKAIAKIAPDPGCAAAPYFLRRHLSARFRRLAAKGKLRGGTDSAMIVSEDREATARATAGA